jgi:hypothetical protein
MSNLPADLKARIEVAAPGGIGWTGTTNAHGVTTIWCELADPADLLPVGGLLKALGARLSTISAFQPKPPEPEDEDDDEDDEEAEEAAPPNSLGGVVIDGKSYEIAYHFDLDGDTLTLVVFLAADAAAVRSLTPLFRNADWTERELMEVYNVRVEGHPNPRRLFVDESVEAGVLERLIPFSTMVNAASTKELWEKIMAAKATRS